MANRFSIGKKEGYPVLCKDGMPVFPLMFWQSLPIVEDLRSFHKAGVEIFSFFRSIPHYREPWWIGPGKYDFSRLDYAMRIFHEAVPDAFVIPRIFLSAPEWWLLNHEEELCGFPGSKERTWYTAPWQGTLHESFASKRYLKEEGEALRMLIRHIQQSSYADAVIGLHLAGGIFGEWHYWSPMENPDTGPAMMRRYGKQIPENPDDRPAEYYDVFFSATVEAIGHFCRIVKKESDYLTASFYGYTPDMVWSITGDHRAAASMHRIPELDMVSAPHSYSRRAIGRDGLYRNYPASLALHGKIFIDEGDDRTWLDGKADNNVEHVTALGTPQTQEESRQLIRREFGNMICNNIGMWYMDLNGGWFRDDILMREITGLVRWGQRALTLKQHSVAEVAVVSELRGECLLKRRGSESNQISGPLYMETMGNLCCSGIPFDWILAEDLDDPSVQRYKVFIFLDCMWLNEKQRCAVATLKNGGRTLIFCYGAGVFAPNGSRSVENLCELTGLELLETSEQLLYNGLFQKPGYVPIECQQNFGSHTCIYRGDPNITSSDFRKFFRDAGIRIYSESDDVFACSSYALMLHATSAGRKCLRLPDNEILVSIPDGEVRVSKDGVVEFELKTGETALFLRQDYKEKGFKDV